MILNFLLVFLYFSSSSLASFPLIPDPQLIESRDDADYRLPINTIPLSYDITLEPTFEPDFEFYGSVVIIIRVDVATNVITLHSNQLTINDDSVSVREEAAAEYIEVEDVSLDAEYHLIRITLQEFVEAGKILELSIDFTGILSTSNRGFYRANYEEGEELKWFATTQFEPTSARQAFPCYDEPALKATFTIHIIRSADYFSISNMKLRQSVPLGDGKFQDDFETSVEMSTYLVAFVVSQMGETEEDENQIVYARSELIDNDRGLYGLQTSIAILKVMEEYTNVAYDLGKLYQVAIPEGFFSSGAMENWGLVTYREQYLLYKEGISTASEKQNVASIIAHELAHQWFGNLVSPLWWNYIWLNEGFATYFEFYATAEVEPEMEMADQFVVRVQQRAMESDALTTTRSMTHDALTPAEISALFDRIAYDKSGSVIRMMEHILTTAVFKRGLTIYLEAMKYDAATADDLWKGLQDAVYELEPDVLEDTTVEEVMEPWNSQAGYPVVTVERSEGEIILSQSRFLLLEATHDYDTIWTIPITFTTSEDPDFQDTKPTHWLTVERENSGIPISDDEWIILNKQSTGYYRVNYDDANWKLIIEHLKSENYDQIHLLNRAQLIDDALNLARSGRLDYATVMDLLSYLSNEKDFVPFHSFFRGLPFLDKHLLNTEYYEEFKRFVREILQGVYEDLGTEDTGTHTQKLNRINIVTWLCRFGDEDCLAKMHDQLTLTNAASPDLQSIVYCSGLISDSDTDLKWDFLYSRYSASTTEFLERNRILTALGCTTSVPHITRLLDIIVDQDGDLTMDSSDKTAAASGIYSNSEIGLETTFDYIIDNFENVRTGLTTNQISTIFNGISDRLTTEEQKIKLENFIDLLSDDLKTEFETIFNNALSNIQNNIDWSEEHVNSIADWLEDHYDNEDEETTTETEAEITTEDEDEETTTDEDITTTEAETEITTEDEDDETTDEDITTTEDPDSGLIFTLSIPLLICTISFHILT